MSEYLLLNLPADAETLIMPISISWEAGEHHGAGRNHRGQWDPITHVGSGWSLVAIIELGCEHEVQFHADPNNPYNSRRTGRVPASMKAALLSRTKDAAEADRLRRAQIHEELTGRFEHAREQEVREATQAIDTFDKRIAELQKELTETETARVAAGVGWHNEELRRRKMEEDIAKLRVALGDLRMREIIGGGP